MVRFEVGKRYGCVSLYGGWLYIEIVARTNEKIIWKYAEQTSDDIDYGYYIALGTDQLYTADQYNEFVKGV